MGTSKRDVNAKRSGELRRETLDNLRDVLRNLSERMGDEHAFDSTTSVPERYEDGDLCIHLHFLSGFGDFCAIFQDCRAETYERILREAIPPLTSVQDAPPGPDDLKQPVLVSIVYLMQQVKRIAPTASPALVWLQPLDSCLMFAAKALNHLSPSATEMGALGALAAAPPRTTHEEDRELGVACRCFGLEKRQLPNDSIEGGAQVMGNFPDANAPIKRWQDVYKNAIRVFSRLRIELRADNFILGFMPEGFLSENEFLKFTLCTPYLEARAIERMHEVYSGRGRQEAEEEAEEAEGPRDSRARARRLPSRPQEGGEALSSTQPPEEIASRTAPGRSGGCSAT